METRTYEEITQCAYRYIGESEIEYFIRLHENKKKYALMSKDIAILLNKEFGVNYDESTWRKRFAEFNRGRIYERELGENMISKRILAISDLHVPFNLPVETFANYADNVDVLILNGDILDCQSISRFGKKYRINFVEEMIAARQYIIDLAELIRPGKIIVTLGNHESRMIKYLSEKVNDDLLQLMPDSPMDLIVNDGFKNNDRFSRTVVYYKPLKEVLDVEIEYAGEWYYREGNVIFAHPLTYASPIMKTTEKAVNFFFRQSGMAGFTSVVLAHTHKVGFYMSGNIRMYEQGCCCRIEEMDYADGKLQSPQQKGYMFICLDKNGDIIEEKTKQITI